MFIQVEELVANSIIELNKVDGSRKVSLLELEVYGLMVIEDLKSRNLCYELIKDPSVIKIFEMRYKSWFTPYEKDGEKGYYLNDDKTIDDLTIQFRRKSSLILLVSFMDNKVIEKWLNLVKKGKQLIRK